MLIVAVEKNRMDILPPHSITKEGQEYLKGLDARGKELHVLAIKMLGSSYFVERTLGFKRWKAAKTAS
jgi:hypothetical protein